MSQKLANREETPEKMVERILGVDVSVFSVGISDLKGEILAYDFGRSVPEGLRQKMASMAREKGYLPALITSILNEQAESIGKVEYIVLALSVMKALFISMPARGIVLIVTMSPNADARGIVLQIRTMYP